MSSPAKEVSADLKAKIKAIEELQEQIKRRFGFYVDLDKGFAMKFQPPSFTVWITEHKVAVSPEWAQEDGCVQWKDTLEEIIASDTGTLAINRRIKKAIFQGLSKVVQNQWARMGMQDIEPSLPGAMTRVIQKLAQSNPKPFTPQHSAAGSSNNQGGKKDPKPEDGNEKGMSSGMKDGFL